ncbi:MAG: hypothetical protein AAFV53_11630 [Myxococcota bacterium]
MHGLLLWMMSAWAQSEEGPCVCEPYDPIQVFSESSSVFIGRAGDTLPNEIRPLIPLKSDLPKRAYLQDTWHACDLKPPGPGEMLLLIMQYDGYVNRCTGSGALPLGAGGGMSEAALREWLQFGGWMDGKPPANVLERSIARELSDHPLQFGEEGVGIEGYSGLDQRIEDVPVRSLQAQVPERRWMVLEALASEDGEMVYLSWRHERGANAKDGPAVWVSHSIWQVTGRDVIPLWRAETLPTPVLRAPPGERLANESLQSPPAIAAFADTSAVAVIPGDRLYSIRLDPERGWMSPETLSDAADAPADAATATGGEMALSVWVQDGALLARRYRPSSGWEPVRQVAASPASSPQVVADEDGGALVIWAGAGGALFGRQMLSNGEWAEPAAITDGAVTEPHAALGAGGAAAVTWIEKDAVMVRRSDGRAAWTPAQRVSGEPDVVGPRVGVDRRGEVVVAWARGGENDRTLWGRRSRGNNWRSLEALRTNPRGTAGLPEVVVTAGGITVVFWAQGGVKGSLWARAAHPRRGWEESRQIGVYGEVIDARPIAAPQADGGLVLGWRAAGSAWTTRYDPSVGFYRISAIEERLEPVQMISISPYQQASAMYLWTQGEGAPVSLWTREDERYVE